MTVKQQREAKRQEKLAEYQRQLKKRQRGKVVWWVVGTVVAAAVVTAIVLSIVFAPRTYTPGGTGAVIEGVETFENDTTHVEGTVDYPQNPPAGGPHNAFWLNCGTYTEPQVAEHAVHSLEHGALWVTYDAEQIQGADLDRLRGLMPSSYVILSPYEGMDTPIALSGWNVQLKVDSVDDPRIPEFIEEYWRHQDVPEPGASCSGAIEGPGRL
ncbi:DUF3105 domain-containing protein [Microbacterium album]|uniref:DUF3105 domain-containing protein n=1 Tax=Microbacterium album TaxID=2053191 RepID=UPI001E5D45CE|nr:DUF3105 domain-containing protein [Microbacterium album]